MVKSNKSSTRNLSPLPQFNPKCAGIDIGSRELFVCISKNCTTQEVRSFPTFTADLKNLVKWLKDNNIESVAMESTGVYWIPSFELLDEAGLEVILVNARIFKSVPGRKSDVQDCQWIQQLHSCGLLQGSFRPENDIVTLRSYTRQRSRHFAAAGTQVQLMQKALIQMNIQLNHVISDITGMTGINIIQAILAGQRDPVELAKLSVGLCRKNETLIAKALEGNYRPEHVFALKQAYEGFEYFHRQIHECEEMIEQTLKMIQENNPIDLSNIPQSVQKNAPKRSYNRSPYHFDANEELIKTIAVDITSIPGVDTSTAIKILSEIGIDMSRWANAAAFSSWLGLSPGNKISGGKVLSSKTKPCSNKAAQALRIAANSLHRSPTALGAFYRRIRGRSGAPKAITATAHKLAIILYNMLRKKENYRELGENYYEQRYQDRVLAALKRKATEMGFLLVPSEIIEAPSA